MVLSELGFIMLRALSPPPPPLILTGREREREWSVKRCCCLMSRSVFYSTPSCSFYLPSQLFEHSLSRSLSHTYTSPEERSSKCPCGFRKCVVLGSLELLMKVRREAMPHTNIHKIHSLTLFLSHSLSREW